jgi:hypothetical protein
MGVIVLNGMEELPKRPDAGERAVEIGSESPDEAFVFRIDVLGGISEQTIVEVALRVASVPTEGRRVILMEASFVDLIESVRPQEGQSRSTYGPMPAVALLTKNPLGCPALVTEGLCVLHEGGADDRCEEEKG